MSKTAKLALALYLLSIFAAVINIRFHLIPVTWISVGRFLVGEIGYADGAQFFVVVLIDFVAYAVFFFMIAFALRAIFHGRKSTSNFQ